MCRTEPLLRSQGDDRISDTTKLLYKPCVPPPRHLDGQGGVITFSENKQGSTGQTDTLETIWLERCVKREREKKKNSKTTPYIIIAKAFSLWYNGAIRKKNYLGEG